MTERKTREAQYQNTLDHLEHHGQECLGLMTNQGWYDDPRRLAFTLSRYKFVSKMMSGFGSVLEVGCADAFAARIVQQEVGSLTAVDFDPIFIEDVNRRMLDRWRFTAKVHDMLAGPVEGRFDGIYTLDVLEHIAPADEDRFLENTVASLAKHGVLIVGMPSLESQPHASPTSKAGHVNCKTQPDLRALLRRWFHNVFVFGMNDEVVHTGYHKMAQYLLALCCDRRRDGPSDPRASR
jgi:2-polyprenyl-3-methyl-5-hydroxy-6-metoxy-1,4-benzoquinol methylase